MASQRNVMAGAWREGMLDDKCFDKFFDDKEGMTTGAVVVSVPRAVRYVLYVLCLCELSRFQVNSDVAYLIAASNLGGLRGILKIPRYLRLPYSFASGAPPAASRSAPDRLTRISEINASPGSA